MKKELFIIKYKIPESMESPRDNLYLYDVNGDEIKYEMDGKYKVWKLPTGTFFYEYNVLLKNEWKVIYGIIRVQNDRIIKAVTKIMKQGETPPWFPKCFDNFYGYKRLILTKARKHPYQRVYFVEYIDDLPPETKVTVKKYLIIRLWFGEKYFIGEVKYNDRARKWYKTVREKRVSLMELHSELYDDFVWGDWHEVKLEEC